MNIKGFEILKQLGLPIPRNTFIFKKIEEIPSSHMNIYGDRAKWIIRGFDYGETNIEDSPYCILEERILKFKNDELKKVFQEINDKMNICGLGQDRVYFVCEVFTDEDVDFSGFAMKDEDAIKIDIKDGNRPSRKDWIPDYSLIIPFHEDKPKLYVAQDLRYRKAIAQICKDMKLFDYGTNIDFCQLKDGYFMYHDLSVVKK